MEQLYRVVKASERSPEKEGYYFSFRHPGQGYPQSTFYYLSEDRKGWSSLTVEWLEPVAVIEDDKEGLENHGDHFKDWLSNDEGKSCMDTEMLKDPKNARFLENRLWWAFNAGHAYGWKDGQTRAAEVKREGEKLSERLKELEAFVQFVDSKHHIDPIKSKAKQLLNK